MKSMYHVITSKPFGFWGNAMRTLRHLASAGALAAVAVSAAGLARAQETVACERFDAWTLDRSARGLPVRAQPTRTARILGHLVDPEEGMSATLLIDGYRSGWFHIVAGDWKPTDPEGNATGWVEANGLMLDIYDPVLRASPAVDAPVSARLRETMLDTRTDNPGLEVRRLLECNGAWKRVSTNRGDGWARDTCGNSVTTCP